MVKLSDVVVDELVKAAVDLMASDRFVFEVCEGDLDHALAYAAQLKQERDALQARIDGMEDDAHERETLS